MVGKEQSFGSGRALVIAEIAQSHEGSFAEAQALVRAASTAKADSVKFQVFQADELAVPSYQYYDLFQKLEFTREEWRELLGLARSLGLCPFADVSGLAGVKLLEELDIDAYKIHASDIQNIALLEAVGYTKRPILLSCGGGTYGEIAEAINILRRAGATSLCLMHGFQASPTLPEETNFLRLTALSHAFDLPVGYADHIAGDHPMARQWPLFSLVAGAAVIEKHLTLNRSEKKEDYISSLNPDEFRQMVEWIRLVEAALGRSDFNMTPSEAEYRTAFRKRVVAACNLARGTKLMAFHLALKRAPGAEGFNDLGDVMGRAVTNELTRNQLITDAALTVRTMHRRLVAALACRAASTRLYCKPLQRIGDRTILEYLVARIRSVTRVDQIILAISEGVENEVFIGYARRLGLEYVVGDEIDVQGRLILAGEKGHADLILRATTEDPFIYTDNIELLVKRHVEEDAALTVCEGLPYGAFCEIITLAALKDAHERGESRHRSELCTLYLVEHPERYKIVRVPAPERIRRKDIRLTVDYPEDLIVCRAVAETLGKDGPLFSLEDIIGYLDAHPALKSVNGWIDTGLGRNWP